MPTIYHPDLPDGENLAELPDSPGVEGTISVLEKSGWTTKVPKSKQEAAPDQGGK